MPVLRRNDIAIRSEAEAARVTLIESVTIYPQGEHGPEAEVVARVSDLVAFAPNYNAAREGGDCGFVRFGCGDRI
jgi:site-specific DNA recombinase